MRKAKKVGDEPDLQCGRCVLPEPLRPESCCNTVDLASDELSQGRDVFTIDFSAPSNKSKFTLDSRFLESDFA